MAIKDSGQRSAYTTGAQRDNAEGKGRFDLIPFQALMRLAKHYEAGAKKYSDRNWEKGMNISRYCDAAMRHLIKYIAGWNDEDHLAAVAWNVFAIMHHESKFPNLQDLPEWNGNVSSYVIKDDKNQLDFKSALIEKHMIIVNGKEKIFSDPVLSYTDAVVLAGFSIDDNSLSVIAGNKILHFGGKFANVYDGMIVNVADTSNA